MTIYLVDGDGELFRHDATARRADPECVSSGPIPAPGGVSWEPGRPVDLRGVRGVLRSIRRLLMRGEGGLGAPGQDSSGHHEAGGVRWLAVALSVGARGWRHRLWPKYKAGREVAARVVDQVPALVCALRAMGVRTFAVEDDEADDALAALVDQAPAEAVQVYICSADKDLAQLVEGRRVLLWDRGRGRVLDARGVRRRWGVGPEQIADWLALAGDSSDGIPGIAGLGPKGAAALLARHGRLEAIPDPAQWDVEIRGIERVRWSRRAAVDWRRLTRLRRRVPLVRISSADDLLWRGPRPEWAEWCRALSRPEWATMAASPL